MNKSFVSSSGKTLTNCLKEHCNTPTREEVVIKLKLTTIKPEEI